MTDEKRALRDLERMEGLRKEISGELHSNESIIPYSFGRHLETVLDDWEALLDIIKLNVEGAKPGFITAREIRMRNDDRDEMLAEGLWRKGKNYPSLREVLNRNDPSEKKLAEGPKND